MIDKMIRCKKLNAFDQIKGLDEWFVKCPPTRKDKKWKDGRNQDLLILADSSDQKKEITESYSHYTYIYVV
jgi:hypothetical protein